MARSSPRLPIMGDLPESKYTWLQFVMNRVGWNTAKSEFVYEEGRDNHSFPIRHATKVDEEAITPGSRQNMNPWFNWGDVYEMNPNSGLIVHMPNDDYRDGINKHQCKIETSELFPVHQPNHFKGMFTWYFAGTHFDEVADLYRIEFIPALVNITEEEGISPSQIRSSGNNAWDTLLLSRCSFGVLVDPADLVHGENPELKKFVEAAATWKPGDFIMTSHTHPGRAASVVVGTEKISSYLSVPDAWARFNSQGSTGIPNTIQSMVGHFHALDKAKQSEGVMIWGVEAKPAEATSDWIHTYSDNRKTKGIGITADVATYWHGYTRCNACNGEVEYKFDKSADGGTFKCPHCAHDTGVVVELEGGF